MKMTFRLAAASIALAIAASPAMAQDMSTLDYPETRRGDVVETQFGEAIADPYRWLENDVRNDAEVEAWVAAQNALTDAYLDTLPARNWFQRRIGELFNFERFSTPVKYGANYFYTRNTGLQNQSPLYVRTGLDAEPRLLLDPNAWAQDGATALAGWAPSPDGSKLLYAVQDGGTDWRILRVIDVATGAQLSDEIRWAKFTSLAWVGEEGFLCPTGTTITPPSRSWSSRGPGGSSAAAVTRMRSNGACSARPRDPSAVRAVMLVIASAANSATASLTSRRCRSTV